MEPAKPARRFGDRLTPGGYRIDEVASALQKEIRRGNEREALFWAFELALAGYTNYCWKRLRIVASEDIGLGEPMMAVLVRTLFANWQEQKKADKGAERHANLFLVHAVLALARAPKSRIVDTAYVVAADGEREPLELPDYALDMHTRAGRKLGRGAAHFYEEGAVISPRAPIDDPYLERARLIDEQAERRPRTRRPADGQTELPL